MDGEETMVEKIVGYLYYSYHIILIIIYILSIFIIFPFFIHFTRINRKKDREASVYRITNHLYKITVNSQIMILIELIAIIHFIFIYFFVDDKESKEYKWIPMLLTIIVYSFNQIIVPIQNLLIFLLAFQRFLIYFFPKSEKYLVLTEQQFTYFIWRVYGFVISGYVIYNIAFLTCTFSTRTLCNYEAAIISPIIYITLDFLVMFSSIFYICILISVQKITSQSKFIRTRPEKVIIYQTLVLLFVKLLCLPFFLYFSYSLYATQMFFGEPSLIKMLYYPLFFIDVLTTPIVFQITYLFCNKTNLENLLKMNFRKAKTWKTILSRHRVEDFHVPHVIMSTTSGI
ncbi:unnamed protein product [Caenorhabditis angaria]|uniref:G-protein coupled receptors family 1 profile domain-containing protein n=1 Tax=Caenorhabditis angaria TaxID=860376 RepID=A0A9P1IUF5_9PELO|nr:unnamed protein product [Caenorhabditis angaria]